MSEWPPPWDDIDPGILEVVRAMYEAGFRTVTACEGGPKHAWPDPYIAVEPWAGTSIEVTAEVVRDWLPRVGLQGCYVGIKHYVGCDLPPFVAIEWWGRTPIDEWLKNPRWAPAGLRGDAAPAHPLAQEEDR